MTTGIEVRRAYYEQQRPRESRMVLVAPEVRDDGGTEFVLSGYASTTDAPYEVNDWLGAYTETIARGAFGKALQESDDVRLLLNHDGIPLARTRSGTLALREITDPLADPQGRGQTGLWCQARIDASSPLAQTVRSAMVRGDLSEMSFAFQATRQEWNADYTQRTVNEVKLFDVSVVTYPANPATTAQMNSARLAGVAARMASKRALTDPDDVAVIQQLLGVLAAIDDVVDARIDVTADYLGVESPDDDDMTPEAPSEDDMARANALAWAQARAHRSV
ncbi:MAG: HK97 family phage prohead protease [Propionibacterium sp.]|nr:HK97 family phage prohead protease [Propionibacterium sp.]